MKYIIKLKDLPSPAILKFDYLKSGDLLVSTKFLNVDPSNQKYQKKKYSNPNKIYIETFENKDKFLALKSLNINKPDNQN